uniref:Uncharacterized protein n=1 Tax=Arundo donax TaxID=35708 RepID=A0A0A9E312_ARUDO
MQSPDTRRKLSARYLCDILLRCLSYALDTLLGLGTAILERQTLHSSTPFLCISSNQPEEAAEETTPTRYHSTSCGFSANPAHTTDSQRMPERGGWDLADLAPPAWSPRARRIRLGAAPLGSAPSELPRASRGPGGERGGRGASPQRSRVRAGGAGRGA